MSDNWAKRFIRPDRVSSHKTITIAKHRSFKSSSCIYVDRQILPDLPGTWRYFKRLLITNHQVFNSDDTATLFPRLLSRHYRFSQTQIYTHVLKKEEKSHLISNPQKSKNEMRSSPWDPSAPSRSCEQEFSIASDLFIPTRGCQVI